MSRGDRDAKGVYRRFAGLYDSASPLWRSWLFGRATGVVEDVLRTSLTADATILDLGCGTGANLEFIAREGLPYASYTGVDFSDEMLSVAKRKLGHLPGVTFIKRDIMADPLPQAEYDVVISTWLLSHLPDPRIAVEKGLERLKPDGRMAVLCLSQPNNSTLGMLLSPFLRLFATRPVSEKTWQTLPGRESIHRDLAGLATVVTLRSTHHA